MIVAFSQRSHDQIGMIEIFDYCMYTDIDLEWSSLKKKKQGINISRYPLFKDFLKLLILTIIPEEVYIILYYFHVHVIARIVTSMLV